MSTGPAAAPKPDSADNRDAHAAALEVIRSVVGDGGVRSASFRDNFRVYLNPDQIYPVLEALKQRCGFAMLSELGGTDYLKYPGRSASAPRFEVHYALLNLDNHERIILKVGVSDPEPTLPSVTSLWGGADWMEREVFDLFGIHFTDHPDLRRLLMPDEFTAHPLRKDYPLRGRGERHNFPRISRGES